MQKIILTLISIIFVLFVAIGIMAAPPTQFPNEGSVTVERGSSLSSIARTFASRNIIRSELLFKIYIKSIGAQSAIKSGTYNFNHPIPLFKVAERIVRGTYDMPLIKITFPEGFDVREMANRLKNEIPNFDDKRFIALATPKEGRLFPDTYFFNPDVTPDSVVKIMEETYEKKIKEIDSFIAEFGKSIKDVTIMASILEEEARTFETKKIIAGILWKRLSIDMPLQVDAAFLKVNGKTTFDLSLNDLAIDSPYNTYKYKGLPPGAISNPGLESLLATVTPITSPYFYYLTDKEGNMRYARTLDEHVANKRKYLK